MTKTIKGGFTPSRMVGSGPNSGGLSSFPIANGYNTNLFHGDPVKLSAGVVQLATDNTPVLGIFQGAYFIDPLSKQPVNSPYFPAGTSSAGALENGEIRPIALVDEGVNKTYLLQATATVSAAMIGNRYRVAIGTGSTLTGQSAALLDATLTVDSSSGAMVRVIDLYKIPNNLPNSATTIVEVVLASVGMVGSQ